MKTVSSGHQRDQNKISALEGVHFRKMSTLESFPEMRVKRRKTHKLFLVTPCLVVAVQPCME